MEFRNQSLMGSQEGRRSLVDEGSDLENSRSFLSRPEEHSRNQTAMVQRPQGSNVSVKEEVNLQSQEEAKSARRELEKQKTRKEANKSAAVQKQTSKKSKTSVVKSNAARASQQKAGPLQSDSNYEYYEEEVEEEVEEEMDEVTSQNKREERQSKRDQKSIKLEERNKKRSNDMMEEEEEKHEPDAVFQNPSVSPNIIDDSFNFQDPEDLSKSIVTLNEHGNPNVDLSMTQQAIDQKQLERISPGMTSGKESKLEKKEEKKHKKLETTEAMHNTRPAGTFL